MNACLDIQLGQEQEQDKACSVTKFSACIYISGVSTAVLICSKKSFAENCSVAEEAQPCSTNDTKKSGPVQAAPLALPGYAEAIKLPLLFNYRKQECLLHQMGGCKDVQRYVIKLILG